MAKDLEQTFASKCIIALMVFCIVFTTLAYGTVHQPTISIFYFIVTVLVVLWVVDSHVTGVFRFSRDLIQLPILATVVYAFIQIIPFGTLAETGGLTGISRTISIEPFWTQMFALHIFAMFLLLAVALVYLDTASRLKKLAAAITIFGFVFSFFAILQAVLSPTKIYGIYAVEYAKPFGSFVNRHNFAAFIEMSMAIPLGLLAVGAIGRDKRLIYLTAIGLMGVALVLSGSRGGLVSMIAAVVFLFLMAGKSHGGRQTALRIGLTVLLIAVVIGGAIMIGGESSLTRFAETATSDDITTNRTHIWAVTLEVIKSNWFFGAGIGSFAAAYTPFDSMNGLERVEQAHNDYLQILADAGIIGLGLAAFFIYRIFSTGFTNVATDNIFRRGIAVGALTGCFAILVHSLFDFVLHTTAITVMFITLIAMLVASGRKFADDDQLYERRRSKRATVTPIDQKRQGG